MNLIITILPMVRLVHALQFFIAMQVQHFYNSSTNGWNILYILFMNSILTFSPITGGCSEGLGVLWFFFKQEPCPATWRRLTHKMHQPSPLFLPPHPIGYSNFNIILNKHFLTIRTTVCSVVVAVAVVYEWMNAVATATHRRCPTPLLRTASTWMPDARLSMTCGSIAQTPTGSRRALSGTSIRWALLYQVSLK